MMGIDNMVIYGILLGVVILLTFLLYKAKERRLNEQFSKLSNELSSAHDKIETQKSNNSTLQDELYATRSQLDVSRLETKSWQERYEDLLYDQNRDVEKFELIANRILDQKSEKFDEQHKKGIMDVLTPLKEKINSFERKVEQTHIDNIQKHSDLQSQIKMLSDLNREMTSEANNLAKALKGDNKIQGNWGEMILESILEKSGLEKDREYFVQKRIPSDNGRILQPDVIIHLPDRKKIIIDSKVSLKAYDEMVSATDEITYSDALKRHTLSIKNHASILSDKNYHDLYTTDMLDFVLMFIPIDTAFSSALSYDSQLYSYAFEKNIVIVTPTTLLATLKTIDSLWNNEKQQRYAMDIATEAGKMYDKLTAFLNDLQKIGKRLDQGQQAYDDALRKLTDGRGNLIAKAEKIKRLGAKANRRIDTSLIRLSEEEE